MKLNLASSDAERTAPVTLTRTPGLKTVLFITMLIGSAVVTMVPTAALAKKGDLYSLKTGGCLKGDVKGKHGWCVEHLSVGAPDSTDKGSTVKSTDSKAAALPELIRPGPGPLKPPPEPVLKL